MCKFDDDPLCLDELLRDDLVAHIPSLKQIDQNCRDGCDDELLLLDKQFEGYICWRAKDFFKLCWEDRAHRS